MPSVSCPSGGRRRQDAIAHSPIEPRRPPPAGFFFAFNHPARQRAQVFPGSALPRVSSPRWGEGGPKGRMRGRPLLISPPLPPHPATATFSPRGEGDTQHPLQINPRKPRLTGLCFPLTHPAPPDDAAMARSWPAHRRSRRRAPPTWLMSALLPETPCRWQHRSGP